MELETRLQSALGDDYTIERELGGGGMSRVFVARHHRLERPVVVKVLAPELAAGISADRFKREIRVAASLQQANIVPLLDAGEADGLPWFTMPYIDGQSLRHRLASGPLSVAESLGILRDVARALGHAHEHGVIHRDIKPDNILLSRGTAEVTDFGIAKALIDARNSGEHDALTQHGTSLGTPAYMSPEQVAGDDTLDHRADIYALGVVGYEMLAGHPPFTGPVQHVMASHLNAEVPPIENRRDVPRALDAVLMRCLAKDPADRFQSADDLLRALDAVSTGDEAASAARGARRAIPMTLAAVALLAVAGWFATSGMRQKRWVRTEAIPAIRALADTGRFDSAWVLARRAEAIAPNDSALAALWPRFSRKAVFTSEPAGATVYRAAFGDTSTWILLGTTPTDSIRISNEIGRVRVEKQGFRTQIGLMASFSRRFLLDAVTDPDSDMVHIPGGTIGAFMVGTEGLPSLKLGDYRLDRLEVTNRQYKAFVDAGGYEKPEYWTALTRAGGDWKAVRSKFVDRTGRPGPATWEAGSYPADQAEMPVGGISWYEAKAYAQFAGKSLPTIYHWARAAAIGTAKYVIPGSNFEGQGPKPVGTGPISLFGALDMAGNVREWCENDDGHGERYILGGGWTDPPYGFTDAYAQPALDRSPINGVRLAHYLHDEPTLVTAQGPQRRSYRDYSAETPVSDATFAGFRQFYDYDPAALDARLEKRDSTTDDWTTERVTYTSAYGERMPAYVLIPRRGRPPFQAVVYFPGSNALTTATGAERNPQLSFIVKTGRIVVLPILKGTYERQDSLRSDIADSTIRWRDHVVMWTKDIRRTVDYLSSRPDVDTSRIAYFGVSWGSNMAPMSLALEPRFKTAVLYVAGLAMDRGRPEVDPLNFLPRVHQPVLMLNGKYDFFFPLELSQKPFFERLGTPAEHKRHLVFEGGHDVPRTELIARTLEWLDRYLGPVKP